MECLQSFYAMMIDLNEKDTYSGGRVVNNMCVEVGRQNDSVVSEANIHFLIWQQVLPALIAKQKEKNNRKEKSC